MNATDLSVRDLMDITYQGTHFNGWQTQPNGITVR